MRRMVFVFHIYIYISDKLYFAHFLIIPAHIRHISSNCNVDAPIRTLFFRTDFRYTDVIYRRMRDITGGCVLQGVYGRVYAVIRGCVGGCALQFRRLQIFLSLGQRFFAYIIGEGARAAGTATPFFWYRDALFHYISKNADLRTKKPPTTTKKKSVCTRLL